MNTKVAKPMTLLFSIGQEAAARGVSAARSLHARRQHARSRTALCDLTFFLVDLLTPKSVAPTAAVRWPKCSAQTLRRVLRKCSTAVATAPRTQHSKVNTSDTWIALSIS